MATIRRTIFHNGQKINIMLQLLRYIIVGGINTVIGYAVILSLVYYFKVNPLISNIVGYSVCLALSFFLNKHFTFRSTSETRKEVIPFIIVFLIAYNLNLGVVALFSYIIILEPWLAQGLGGIIYVASSYYFNKLFVFRK